MKQILAVLAFLLVPIMTASLVWRERGARCANRCRSGSSLARRGSAYYFRFVLGHLRTIAAWILIDCQASAGDWIYPRCVAPAPPDDRNRCPCPSGIRLAATARKRGA